MQARRSVVIAVSCLVLSCMSLSPVDAGYCNETLVPLVRLIKGIFMNELHSISMLEFGNQEVHDKEGMFYRPFVDEGFYSSSFPTKYFFEHMGLKHVSVDLNEMDGSLPLDCRFDLTKNLSKADVITNIGFSEHVGEGVLESNIVWNQYTMFKNMHDLGKVGTLYYHDFVVNFPRHGVVNYGLEFIFALPRRSNYVLLLEPFKSLREAFNENGEEIVTYVAAFRKVTDEPFMSFQEFQELPGLINIFEQYGLYRRVTVQIFGSETLSGERTTVFEIDQVLHPEKSLEQWAASFCQDYFTNTAADRRTDNAFLANNKDFAYCVKLTLYSIEMSSIEHAIRH